MILLIYFIIIFNLTLSMLYPDNYITVIIMLSTLLQCCIVIVKRIKLIVVVLRVDCGYT